MTTRRTLRLHHELLLLALHDRKGTVAFGRMLHVGMAGAAFAELTFEGRVTIRTELRGRRKARQRVEVVSARRVGEEILDAALERLASARRPQSPSKAISRVAHIKRFHGRVAQELARKGVVRATEEDVLLFFRRKVYPTLDPGPERALVERIRAALEGGEVPDDRTALLIGIARPTGTLRALYDRRELRALKSRIEAVSEMAGTSGEAVDEAVRAASAAVVAATTAAVTAAAAAG